MYRVDVRVFFFYYRFLVSLYCSFGLVFIRIVFRGLGRGFWSDLEGVTFFVIYIFLG